MSPDREQMLLREYRAWDPSHELFIDFCERVGISRQAMYTVLERNNIPRKTQYGEGVVSGKLDGREKQAYDLFDRLIQELARKERRILELEEELRALRGD